MTTRERTFKAALTLLIHGELWSAENEDEALALGNSALVVGIKGLRLRAKRGER